MHVVIPSIVIRDCSQVSIVREPQTHSVSIKIGATMTIQVFGDGEIPAVSLKTETIAKEKEGES